MLLFLAGILVGALFTLPIVPYELPDGAATILGAVTGAGIAVASATWMNQQKERRHTARLNIAAQTVSSELVRRACTCLEIIAALDGSITPMNSLQKYKFDYLAEAGAKALTDFEEMKPSFTQNPGNLLTYVNLRNGVEELLNASKKILENNDSLTIFNKQLKQREANPNAKHPPMIPVMRHSKGELNLKLRDLEFHLRQIGSW